MGESEDKSFHVRGHLGDFVSLMETKLAEKDEQHPEGWSGDSLESLFDQADDRMDKLITAIDNQLDNETIGGLAVDIANWMSMIADNVGYLNDFYGK